MVGRGRGEKYLGRPYNTLMDTTLEWAPAYVVYLPHSKIQTEPTERKGYRSVARLTPVNDGNDVNNEKISGAKKHIRYI